MFDRAQFWPPAPDWNAAAIIRADVEISAAPSGFAYLLSGKATAMAAAVAKTRRAAQVDVLRLAADRILLLADAEMALAEGWHQEGFAVSALHGAHLRFDITGPGARALCEAASPSLALARGAKLAAAAVSFAGVTAYVEERAQGLRLYVEHPQAASVWQWLLAAISEKDQQDS